jgi:hypothetical protein
MRSTSTCKGKITTHAELPAESKHGWIKSINVGLVVVEPKATCREWRSSGLLSFKGTLCDRTTSKMRGFVSQDHIGGFSTKRECANTHK